METLLKKCIAEKPVINETKEELEKYLGNLRDSEFFGSLFSIKEKLAILNGYLRIPEEKLWDYAKREFVKKFGEQPKRSGRCYREPSEKHSVCIELLWTHCRSSLFNSVHNELSWLEYSLSNVVTPPTPQVLENLAKAKDLNLFDYFTVGSCDRTVFSSPKGDPLLLGRIFNSTDAFLIGIWGSDIILDDLI